jgi:hypothetical protein
MQLTINESYLANPDTYVGKGMVEGTSTISRFLIFPMSSDDGYRAAIADALEKSGADGLINVVSDVQIDNYLIYSEVTTTVQGIAIKKKWARNRPPDKAREFTDCAPLKAVVTGPLKRPR